MGGAVKTVEPSTVAKLKTRMTVTQSPADIWGDADNISDFIYHTLKQVNIAKLIKCLAVALRYCALILGINKVKPTYWKTLQLKILAIYN